MSAPAPFRIAELSVEAIFRRDRALTVIGIMALTALSWFYLLGLARAMPPAGSIPGMDGIQAPVVADELPGTPMTPAAGAGAGTTPMTRAAGAGAGATPMTPSAGAALAPTIAAWGASDFVFMFLMWSVMMVAMMLPSASPTILLHVSMYRQQGAGRDGVVGTAAFAGGYLLAWVGFSAAATLLQWSLERLALLSPMMVATSPALGAGLFVVAGVYQLTPLKRACLSHCRSPVQFLMQHWRRGRLGALQMGLHHGLYCIGCCWFLMGVLFVGGVMNLLWIAALAVLVLIEKLLPGGLIVARLAGASLVTAGIYVLSNAR